MANVQKLGIRQRPPRSRPRTHKQRCFRLMVRACYACALSRHWTRSAALPFCCWGCPAASRIGCHREKPGDLYSGNRDQGSGLPACACAPALPFPDPIVVRSSGPAFERVVSVPRLDPPTVPPYPSWLAEPHMPPCCPCPHADHSPSHRSNSSHPHNRRNPSSACAT